MSPRLTSDGVNLAARRAQLALTYPDHPDLAVQAIQAELCTLFSETLAELGNVYRAHPGGDGRRKALDIWADKFEAAVDRFAQMRENRRSDKEVTALASINMPLTRASLRVTRVAWMTVGVQHNVRLRVGGRQLGTRVTLRRSFTEGDSAGTFHDVICETSDRPPLMSAVCPPLAYVTAPEEFIKTSDAYGDDWLFKLRGFCKGWTCYA